MCALGGRDVGECVGGEGGGGEASRDRDHWDVPPQSPRQGIMRKAGGEESQGVWHKAQRHVSSR